MASLKGVKIDFAIMMFRFKLKLMSLILRLSSEKRKEISNPDTGFIFNGKYQFMTRDGKVHVYIIFKDGKMKSRKGVIDNPNVTISFKDKETMARIYNKSAEESLDYLLTNDMSYTGNMSYLTKFSYMTSIITGGKKSDYQGPENRLLYPISDIDKGEKRRKLNNEILGRKVDIVQILEDPYLGKYSIDDVPRLRALKNRRFALKPAICIERARLITEFHRKNGFEVDAQGNPFDPNLRQAMAINHIMVNRKPIIHDRHLLAGSTTSKEVGVPIYPEFIGTTIWPELRTIGNRKLNPNDLSDEDADILNFEVFPYWMDRNVREYCRTKYGNPVSQQLEERFVLYFMMKNNAISHTVPGFKKVLTEGLKKIKQDALDLEKRAASPEKKNFYKAVQIVNEGAMTYAKHLSEEALRIAATLNPADPDQLARMNELKEIARICAKVPANPADSVYEAVMAIWLSFVCLHSENANSALSIGRLDQMLQPYFLKEIVAAKSDAEKEVIIKRSIELVGSLFLRFNDDDPLMPNVGNKLFGGSSSDDTVTVGGVDQAGNNAVCDMTYIVLKAAEMMCFQDPNMNARYYPGINSKEYLRRLCEVNINMAASPSLHNDKQMIDALVHQGIPIEYARDWAATGCVEPTISGKHYGHTNCMLVNMVAPLEAALNNGIHPIMGERIGPQTGEVRNSFSKYDDFLNAYKTQLKYLIDQSIEINNDLGVTHQYIHPTPLLSAMTTGPLEKGKDIIYGGAVYNTSGVAMVSITDAVDSLYVIKKLIYERQILDFPTLMNALEKNFDDGFGETLLKINKVPKFGSGEEEPIKIAQDLINFCYDAYQAQDNYRGGKYLPGYWSISYHVGFGMLSGALPSGRKKGKAFTPGLTPAPGASDQLIQNIHTIAALDHLKMPNNIAFNVKLVPHAGDSHEQTLNYFTSYVQSYFEEGGMQWQFNVVTTDMMREAMDHPEDYRWLIVRISGYNAYFVKLNKNMQIELIERTEFQTS
jgi:pyruvate formate-lyase/glycerol dehydratase family glycyl radical enzyme